MLNVINVCFHVVICYILWEKIVRTLNHQLVQIFILISFEGTMFSVATPISDLG